MSERPLALLTKKERVCWERFHDRVGWRLLDVKPVSVEKVTIDIMSTDQTNDVLETTINMIGVNETNTYYFALYLIEDQTGKVTVRRLQDFESPYISLKRAAAENRIQLRTAFWDRSVAELLYDDSIALNLLYIETMRTPRRVGSRLKTMSPTTSRHSGVYRLIPGRTLLCRAAA